MHKLIPLLYFYLVSLIGLVLLIIGVFSSIHFVVNILSFSDYPLAQDFQQCPPAYPLPLMLNGGTGSSSTKTIAQPLKPSPAQTQPNGDMAPYPYYFNCTKQLALEREKAKANDLEKALSFTVIGLLVFGIHFYYARRIS